MSLTQSLRSRGLQLPAVPGPFGAYIPAKRVGNLLYIAGQLPMKEGKLLAAGTVPATCSIEQARVAAEQCVINALAAAQTIVADLDEIVGVVRVGAFVASEAGFGEQPKVANAASELLLSLFGEAGKHVRAAVGVNTLPLGAAVEIEFLFELRE